MAYIGLGWSGCTPPSSPSSQSSSSSYTCKMAKVLDTNESRLNEFALPVFVATVISRRAEFSGQAQQQFLGKYDKVKTLFGILRCTDPLATKSNCVLCYLTRNEFKNHDRMTDCPVFQEFPKNTCFTCLGGPHLTSQLASDCPFKTRLPAKHCYGCGMYSYVNGVHERGKGFGPRCVYRDIMLHTAWWLYRKNREHVAFQWAVTANAHNDESKFGTWLGELTEVGVTNNTYICSLLVDSLHRQ